MWCFFIQSHLVSCAHYDFGCHIGGFLMAVTYSLLSAVAATYSLLHIIKGIFHQPDLLAEDVHDIKSHRHIHSHFPHRHIIPGTPADIKDLFVIDRTLVPSMLIIMTILHLDEAQIAIFIPGYDVELSESPAVDISVNYPVSTRYQKPASHVFHLGPDLAGRFLIIHKIIPFSLILLGILYLYLIF